MESDRDIIEKILSGDENLFRILIQKYKNIIFRYVLSYIPNLTDAEEVTQDVFIKLYFSLDKFRFEAGLLTYLYRIARNLCVDKLRKNKEDIYLDEIQDNLLFKDDKVEIEQDISLFQLLSKIPDRERVVIELFYIDRQKYREISETLKIPIGTVKSRITRGIDKLKEVIKNEKT